jgi:mRNA-degrading endonuclease toxin of MazEF toxin-antitoxin module
MRGKALPVVILQYDSFDGTESITVCAFTTDDTDAPRAIRNEIAVFYTIEITI